MSKSRYDAICDELNDLYGAREFYAGSITNASSDVEYDRITKRIETLEKELQAHESAS
jgi:hypothetical protein